MTQIAKRRAPFDKAWDPPDEEFCLHTHKWVQISGGRCSNEHACIEEAHQDGRGIPCPWYMINKMQQQEEV